MRERRQVRGDEERSARTRVRGLTTPFHRDRMQGSRETKRQRQKDRQPTKRGKRGLPRRMREDTEA